MAKNKSTRSVLEELKARVNDLWANILCRSPGINTNDLMQEHMMIRKALLDISAIQTRGSGMEMNENEDNIANIEQRKVSLDEFLKWVDRVEIKHENVNIVFIESLNGFGLESSRKLCLGSDVLQVPRKAIFSWDLAKRSVFMKRCFERDVIVQSMTNVALALMLCAQKRIQNSSWRPYLNVLPRSFDTPLYFTVDELQSLRPSPIFEESLLLFRNVARQFAHFLLAVIDTDKYRMDLKRRIGGEPLFLNSPFTWSTFTFDLYRWAVACISTRVNLIPSQIEKDNIGQPVLIPSLIPVLDMANHKYTVDSFYEAVHFSEELDCAEIIAVNDYESGDPITIFYGWRSSRDFLLHNGFLPTEKNLRDVYKLKIGLPKNKREPKRLELIESLGFKIESNIFAFEVKVLEPYLHDTLIKFAQYYVLDSVHENDLSKLLTLENTVKAWKFLRDRFALLRRAYNNVLAPEELKDLNIDSGDTSSAGGVVVEDRKKMIARLKVWECDIVTNVEAYCQKQVQNLSN